MLLLVSLSRSAWGGSQTRNVQVKYEIPRPPPSDFSDNFRLEPQSDNAPDLGVLAQLLGIDQNRESTEGPKCLRSGTPRKQNHGRKMWRC